MVKNSTKKKEILDKAGALFWKNGYERTTMREIARACGFDPANLYNYFNNKEQILFKVLESEITVSINNLKHLENDTLMSSIEQLRNFISVDLRWSLSYSTSFRILFDVEMNSLSSRHLKRYIQLRNDYERILFNIIHRGVEKGVFTTPDEKVATYSIMSMLTRSRIWYSPQGCLSTAQIAEIMFDFAAHGLHVEASKLREMSFQGKVSPSGIIR